MNQQMLRMIEWDIAKFRQLEDRLLKMPLDDKAKPFYRFVILLLIFPVMIGVAVYLGLEHFPSVIENILKLDKSKPLSLEIRNDILFQAALLLSLFFQFLIGAWIYVRDSNSTDIWKLTTKMYDQNKADADDETQLLIAEHVIKRLELPRITEVFLGTWWFALLIAVVQVVIGLKASVNTIYMVGLTALLFTFTVLMQTTSYLPRRLRLEAVLSLVAVLKWRIEVHQRTTSPVVPQRALNRHAPGAHGTLVKMFQRLLSIRRP